MSIYSPVSVKLKINKCEEPYNKTNRDRYHNDKIP